MHYLPQLNEKFKNESSKFGFLRLTVYKKTKKNTKNALPALDE